MSILSTWEEQLQQLRLQRQEITEQSGCPMIRFVVDDAACILPYSYLVQAECHVRDDHFRIIAIWPDFIVTIERYHLDQLTDWLAEHRLHSVTLRTNFEESRRAGEPYLECIRFAAINRLDTQKPALSPLLGIS